MSGGGFYFPANVTDPGPLSPVHLMQGIQSLHEAGKQTYRPAGGISGNTFFKQSNGKAS